MSLIDLLDEALANQPDALLAGVIGTDGLRVELVYTDDPEFDLELAELELATLAAQANAASLRIGSGSVLALTLESEGLIFCAELITPGYFAVIATLADSDLGLTREVLAGLVERVHTEL
ncbi:MAG: hypothetical protein AB4911_10275 [Oscillochloridaceae bacterium umkhey_bin13]